ncbi:hypothetical protein MKX03_010826 [Papaver bracteatum]|nr:hypothetical protein MKX03_010826 [Papaver bracteatum]
MAVCKICMEVTPRFHMGKSTNKCSHTCCPKCITKHIATKLKDNPEDTISHKVLDRWENALCESSVLASHCPFKDCSVMLVNDEDREIVRSTECPRCNRMFCAQCEVPWHSDLTCDDFQEIKRGTEEDMLLINLAKNQKWTRCPSCRFYVDGCPHITCRCSYQFCYKCGNSWTHCNVTVRKKWFYQGDFNGLFM